MDNESPISFKATVEETTTETTLAVATPQPFLWEQVPEDKRPAGPRMDWVMHHSQLTEAQLRQRWQGLGFDWEIDDLYRWSTETQRHRMLLDEMAKNGEAPLEISSPEFQKRMNERDFLLVDGLFVKEVGMFQQNLEPEGRSVLNKTKNSLVKETRYRPMNARERNMSQRTISGLLADKRVLTGQASSIVAVQTTDMSEEKKIQAAAELKAFRERITAGGKITVREITVEGAPESLLEPSAIPELPDSKVWESVEVSP